MLFLKRRFSAPSVYLIFSGAGSLFFALITTVNLVYMVEIAKLTPLQLVLVGTTLETICFLCQVPTGVLADVYSRRLAVITGTLVIGIGFVIEGSIPQFVTIVIAQGLFGIGATLTDGAEQAWIAGEVGEDKVGSIFLRSSQISLCGGLIGTLVSVGLASIWLNLPIVIGGGLTMLLAGFLSLVMPENGFRPTSKEERQTWREMVNTFRTGIHVVRLRPVLMTIMLIGLFYGLYSEGFDRLSVDHFLTNFTFPTLWSLKPVVWFGIFSITGTLVSMMATEVVKRTVDLNDQRMVTRALFGINALGVVSVLVFGLAGSFALAAAAYLCFGVFRRVNGPVYTAWLTRNVDAKVRATVISMAGQIDALGQIIGGPPVGYIGSVFSLRAAMVAVGILLSPVLLLFTYGSRKQQGKDVRVDEVEAIDISPSTPPETAELV